MLVLLLIIQATIYTAARRDFIANKEPRTKETANKSQMFPVDN